MAKDYARIAALAERRQQIADMKQEAELAVKNFAFKHPLYGAQPGKDDAWETKLRNPENVKVAAAYDQAVAYKDSLIQAEMAIVAAIRTEESLG